MNLPIVASLAGFAAGAALLQTCARLPPQPLVLSIGALCATGALLRAAIRGRGGESLAVVAVAAAAGLLGFFYAAWRAEERLADALPPAWEERDVRVVGIVDDLPQNSTTGSRFAFAIERVVTPGAIVPRRVSLGWYSPRASDDDDDSRVPVVHAGERWTLTLRLKRPHGNVNPDGFDLEAWLLEHDLRATGYVREDAANVRASAFAGRFGDHVQRARERVRARIVAALPGAPYAGVLTALAIGDQRAIPEAQWLVFNRTGITHLVSISGLHVTVFATLAGACALALARRSPVLTSRVPARKIAAVVGAFTAFGYVLLAGAEVPAVRTLLMLLVAAGGLWLGRPGTASLVWLWSLAAVLLWDPWASLAPGFWLSFGAVGLLLYAGSGRLREPRGRGWRARLCDSLREAAHAQWVVTLGLVPGTLALFQQVSVVSALANAVAIPVVTLGVVPLALFGVVVPIDAPWLLAHAVVATLMRYLQALASLPAAAWVSHAPLGWTVALAIAGSLWLLAPRGVPGRALGAVWAVPMALLMPPGVPAGGLRVVVLDVGQGLAVFVATARHTLLYDTGPRFNDSVDAGGRIVVPFLRAAGVGRLDVLVVSHADNDHSGGALSILRAVDVGRMMTSLPRDHPIVVEAGGERRAEARGNEAPGASPVTRCVAGERWSWDGVTFEIVHPGAAAYDDAARKSNDRSCVLRIVSAGGNVLLTGDVEAASESEMLARDAATLRADILVVPHHGSRTSSTPAFIEAVAPRIAVIAAGYRNRFGHPRGEILARYARVGAARPRTDLEGAISVSLAPERPAEAIGERTRRRRYWYAPARAPVSRRSARAAPPSRRASAAASA
jgi:competence protein ComEC